MESQSLQERTGQVAPQANNPQPQPAQPYQQSGSDLQVNNSQLLNSPSNARIILPVGEGNSSSTQVPVISTKSSNYSFGLVFITFGLILLLCVIFMKRSKKITPEAEVLQTKPPVHISVAVDAQESPKINRPKVKKSKNNKKKKSKKKK